MIRNTTWFYRSVAVVIIIFNLIACNTPTKNTKAGSSSQSIMVYAAASLSDVLSEIADSFEIKYRVNVKTNMASSGTLARQIEQGGTPDVYVSASKEWAGYIDSLGYIVAGYKSKVAKNELVLVVPENSPLKVAGIDSSLNFVSLLGTGRLSMGDPVHVPAGAYAYQSLAYYGWVKRLDNRILPAMDVRSALRVVEMDEAPVGIVYRTDALKSDNVRILASFPEKSHQPIVYIAGVCTDKKAAEDFFAYLNSNETMAIWIKYGFKK